MRKKRMPRIPTKYWGLFTFKTCLKLTSVKILILKLGIAFVFVANLNFIFCKPQNHAMKRIRNHTIGARNYCPILYNWSSLMFFGLIAFLIRLECLAPWLRIWHYRSLQNRATSTNSPWSLKVGLKRMNIHSSDKFIKGVTLWIHSSTLWTAHSAHSHVHTHTLTISLSSAHNERERASEMFILYAVDIIYRYIITLFFCSSVILYDVQYVKLLKSF